MSYEKPLRDEEPLRDETPLRDEERLNEEARLNHERTLLGRAARGDREALDGLIAAHRPAAFAVARALLGEADAEDVVQEVSIRLSTAASGFRGDSELKTWVYRVTLNLCRDHIRRRQREASDVELDSVENEATLASDVDPIRPIQAQRLHTALEAALGRLPLDQREAVTLRYLSDLPYKEIARMTDVPLGTVASRVFRALKQLGRELEPKHLEMLK